MRKSNLILIFFSLCIALLALSVVDSGLRRQAAAISLERMAQQVRELGLSDLALFTEARYTRHLTQSDLHTAFQDHPMSFEHFPSGSLVLPPNHLLP